MLRKCWYFFLLKAKRNKSLSFPTRQPAQSSRTQKAKHTGCVLLKGKTMPLSPSQGIFFCFLFNSCWGKRHDAKTLVQSEAELKEFQNKEEIQNELQIVHSLNLRLPFFRLGWCGTHSVSHPTDFHSIRRSGGVLVLFCYRKRTSPRGHERAKHHMCLVENTNHRKKMNVIPKSCPSAGEETLGVRYKIGSGTTKFFHSVQDDTCIVT